jgi:hypothetical protein
MNIIAKEILSACCGGVLTSTGFCPECKEPSGPEPPVKELIEDKLEELGEFLSLQTETLEGLRSHLDDYMAETDETIKQLESERG